MLSSIFTDVWFRLLASIGYNYEHDVLAVNDRDNWNRKAYIFPEVDITATRDIINIYCNLVIAGKIPEYDKDPRYNPLLKFKIEKAVFEVYGQDYATVSSTLWELYWITKTTNDLYSNALLEPRKFSLQRKELQTIPKQFQSESGTSQIDDIFTLVKYGVIGGLIIGGAYALATLTDTVKTVRGK